MDSRPAVRVPAMSNNYGRPAYKPQPFPRSLAEAIARKADTMARRFEDQAIEQMVRDAKGALRRGTEPAEIARQMGL
ncbi:hypothetical protein D3C80_1933870 [compost metagenome]